MPRGFHYRRAIVKAFSPVVRDIFESFDFHTRIDRLAKAGLLYLSRKNSPTSTSMLPQSAMTGWVRCSRS